VMGEIATVDPILNDDVPRNGLGKFGDVGFQIVRIVGRHYPRMDLERRVERIKAV
jgi:hypothetical protein